MMKYYFLFTFSSLLFVNISAQKHDYNFIQNSGPIGQTSFASISFQDSIQDIVLDVFQWDATVSASPIFSDKNGKFLGFTNNRHVYDSIGRVAINGEAIAVGYFQNFFLNNFPEHTGVRVGEKAAFIPITDSLFYLFHKSSEVWIGSPEWAIDVQEMGQPLTAYSDGLYLTKVILTENGRLFLPEADKKQLIVDDLLENNQLLFCKHANNKDWWIISPKVLTNEAYRLRLSENGTIDNQGTMYFSEHNGRVRSSSAVSFRPDGQQFARLVVCSDTSFRHKLEVFHFDRCTGEAESFFVDSLQLTERFSSNGDIEYSANGRFLYVAISEIILQMDMDDPDFFANRDTIAQWDGFEYASFLPTLFDSFWRLPNGKILVGSGVSTPYLHYIHSPNEKGEDCNFEQRALQFPVDPLNAPFHVFIHGLPSYPPYRMEALDVECVSASEAVAPIVTPIQVFPNPFSNTINIRYAKQHHLKITNVMGETVAYFEPNHSEHWELNLSDYQKGIYFFSFLDKQSGKVVTKKVIKLR